VFFLKIVSNGYHFTLELKFKFVAVWIFVGEFAERSYRGVVLERVSGNCSFIAQESSPTLLFLSLFRQRLSFYPRTRIQISNWLEFVGEFAERFIAKLFCIAKNFVSL
jgi:hypothetical protein